MWWDKTIARWHGEGLPRELKHSQVFGGFTPWNEIMAAEFQRRVGYATLVLPEQDHVPSEVLAKVRSLVVDGAMVIGHKRPTRSDEG